MTERIFVGQGDVHAWIASRSGLVWVADFQGIAREVDGKVVAAVGYDHHQGSSCSFHIAADPGAITRRLLFHAFATPFFPVEQGGWGYKVMLGIIQAGNKASLDIASRLGFTEWGTLPDGHTSGALHFFRMTREECPWLRITRKTKHERRRTSPEGSGSQ